MSPTYDPLIHEYLTSDHLGDGKRLMTVMHSTGRNAQVRFWVQVCSGEIRDDLHPDICRVTDGTSDGCDDMGICLMSLPLPLVSTFLSEDEARQYEEMASIDEQMLANAR